MLRCTSLMLELCFGGRYKRCKLGKYYLLKLTRAEAKCHSPGPYGTITQSVHIYLVVHAVRDLSDQLVHFLSF
jgi:hypothetical protein